VAPPQEAALDLPAEVELASALAAEVEPEVAVAQEVAHGPAEVLPEEAAGAQVHRLDLAMVMAVLACPPVDPVQAGAVVPAQVLVLVQAQAGEVAQALVLAQVGAAAAVLEAVLDPVQEQAGALVLVLVDLEELVLEQEQVMAALATEVMVAPVDLVPGAAGEALALADPEVKMTTMTMMMTQSCYKGQVVKNLVNLVPPTLLHTS